MADIEKTIAIIFEGDDRIGKTISGLSKNLDSLGSTAASATQPLADLASSALKLEAALAAMVAGGIVLAVTESAKFSDAFAEINTLLDISSENANKFKGDIVDYARVSTASIEDINAAVYTAISAGTDYKDSLDLLNTSERLATAGKADLESTTRLLASTLNSYGTTTDEAARYSDAFFKTVKLGQTTLPELANSLAQVTPLAANLEVPIETLTAAIAALTAAGVPTSQAISQIRGALTAIAKPSSEAGKIIADLGVDFSASAVKTKGFEVVLGEVFRAAEGNVEVLSRIFGRVEALNAGLILGRDENGKFADSLNELSNAAGATEEAFRKMEFNINQVVQTLENNLRAVLIDFGGPLLDETVDLTRAITGAFTSLSFAFDAGAFDPLYDALESAAAVAVENIEAIAAALPEALAAVDYTDLIKSVQNLGETLGDLFSAFFDDIDITTPEGLAAAIQKLVDVGTGLTNVVEGILDSWEPFVAAIGDAVDEFASAEDAAQSLIGQFLGWGQVINTVADNIGILTGALNVVAGSLSIIAGTSIVNTIAAFKSFSAVVATAAVGVGQFVAVLAAPVAGFALGTFLRENVPIVREFGDALGELAFNIINFGDDSVSAAEKQAAYTQSLGEAAVAMVRAKEAAGELPSQVTSQVDVEGVENFQDTFDSILTQIQEFPETKETEVSAEIDRPSFEVAERFILEVGEDGSTVIVDAKPDLASISDTKSEIETIPSEREIEVRIRSEAEIEIAKIEAQAKTLQTAFRYKAEVDIAEVEALAETVIALSGDIAESFKGSGELIASLAAGIGDLSASEFLDVSRWIEEENARRDELLRLQGELTRAQVEFLNEKKKQLQSGGGIVTIRGENLEPELQLVLSRIIELTQIESNAQGLEFLIGL